MPDMRYIQLDVKLSDWAEYVGQDKNGDYWEYELRPVEDDINWKAVRWGEAGAFIYRRPTSKLEK